MCTPVSRDGASSNICQVSREHQHSVVGRIINRGVFPPCTWRRAGRFQLSPGGSAAQSVGVCQDPAILPDCLVTVIDVKWYGSAAIELTYKDPAGKPNVVLLYRDREPTLEIGEAGQPWSFDGDGKLFRLVSEAHRINLAHLFDPLLAIHTSMVDPLPHQITAVYGEMLPRQPLRFLLADDPGAGKTIMAGLLIKELLIRGDLHRCIFGDTQHFRCLFYAQADEETQLHNLTLSFVDSGQCI